MTERSSEEIMAALQNEKVSIAMSGDDWALVSAIVGRAALEKDPRYQERLQRIEKHIDLAVVVEIDRRMTEKGEGDERREAAV